MKDADNGNKTLVIVPAYNEERSILSTLQELSKFPYDIVVINDGSADRTGDICRINGVRLVELPFNQGLAAAFQTGMKYARLHGYGSAIQFDADGQHVAEYIGPMVRKLEEGYDIVIGSRFIDGKKSVSFRGFGMALLRGIVRLTVGVVLSDPTSGMRVYNRSMIELFSRSVNFGPEPDTVAYLLRSGARVAEVPVTMRERTAGKSYFGAISSAKYMSRMFLSILLIQFVRAPIHIPGGSPREEGAAI